MKKKLIADISANSLQVIINQLCGLVIFYLLSTRLSKNTFGELNWTLAVLLTIFSILSFGIDQVIVKKIAAAENASISISVYSMHVLLSGLIVYLLLFSSNYLFPGFFKMHYLLLLIGAGKLFIFFSSPFKQFANGTERFRPLLLMSTASNIIRSIALLLFFLLHRVSSNTVVLIFILGDVSEFIVCLVIARVQLKFPFALNCNFRNYTALVKESLPQLGVVLFTSSLSRFDWIFLGIFSTTAVLANYSFAYKVFEMATLPLLAIAPILIPRFAKLFSQNNKEIPAAKKQVLATLLRTEIIISCTVVLLLNSAWSPAVDFITDGKYGAVNSVTVLILSASMPFLYYNNFLWTISFSLGDFKNIFRIFLVCFLVNTGCILALVPFFNAEGAATAYLISIMVQSVLFTVQHKKRYAFTYNIFSLLIIAACAATALLLPQLFVTNLWLRLFMVFGLYIFLLGITGQFKKSDWLIITAVTRL